MYGIILGYSFSDGKGVITTDEGQRFTFIAAEWKEAVAPERGMRVDFDSQQPNEAFSIYLAITEYSNLSVSQETTTKGNKPYIAISIIAFVLSILTFLVPLDSSFLWDTDVVLGWIVFVIASLGAGIAVLINDFSGRGLAIAAIIISCLSLLIGLGIYMT